MHSLAQGAVEMSERYPAVALQSTAEHLNGGHNRQSEGVSRQNSTSTEMRTSFNLKNMGLDREALEIGEKASDNLQSLGLDRLVLGNGGEGGVALSRVWVWTASRRGMTRSWRTTRASMPFSRHCSTLGPSFSRQSPLCLVSLSSVLLRPMGGYLLREHHFTDNYGMIVLHESNTSFALFLVVLEVGIIFIWSSGKMSSGRTSPQTSLAGFTSYWPSLSHPPSLSQWTMVKPTVLPWLIPVPLCFKMCSSLMAY